LAFVREFPRPEATEAFGDIARRGAGRIANLIPKAEIPCGGAAFRQSEYFPFNFRCRLPGFDILKAPRDHSSGHTHSSCLGAGRRMSNEFARTENGERRTWNVNRSRERQVMAFDRVV